MKLKVATLISVFLPDLNKTDVAVRNHRFALEVTANRDKHKQRFGGCDDTANRMHCELLHDAIDRCGQQL